VRCTLVVSAASGSQKALSVTTPGNGVGCLNCPGVGKDEESDEIVRGEQVGPWGRAQSGVCQVWVLVGPPPVHRLLVTICGAARAALKQKIRTGITRK